MFCKYCGKKIDDDSVFCRFCGKKINGDKVKENDHENTYEPCEPVRQDGIYASPDGEVYKVRNRILYDEDGWDVGKVPDWWG